MLMESPHILKMRSLLGSSYEAHRDPIEAQHESLVFKHQEEARY